MKKTLLNGLRLLSACILLMFASGVEPLHADTSIDPLNISQYKGQVIYLDFWASWCGPCRLSFPYMEQIQSYYKSKGLVLLAVNVDHSRDKADAFLARFGPDMPVVFDSKGKEVPSQITAGFDGKRRILFLADLPPVVFALIGSNLLGIGRNNTHCLSKLAFEGLWTFAKLVVLRCVWRLLGYHLK